MRPQMQPETNLHKCTPKWFAMDTDGPNISSKIQAETKAIHTVHTYIHVLSQVQTRPKIRAQTLDQCKDLHPLGKTSTNQSKNPFPLRPTDLPLSFSFTHNNKGQGQAEMSGRSGRGQSVVFFV